MLITRQEWVCQPEKVGGGGHGLPGPPGSDAYVYIKSMLSTLVWHQRMMNMVCEIISDYMTTYNKLCTDVHVFMYTV